MALRAAIPGRETQRWQNNARDHSYGERHCDALHYATRNQRRDEPVRKESAPGAHGPHVESRTAVDSALVGRQAWRTWRRSRCWRDGRSGCDAIQLRRDANRLSARRTASFNNVASHASGPGHVIVRVAEHSGCASLCVAHRSPAESQLHLFKKFYSRKIDFVSLDPLVRR